MDPITAVGLASALISFIDFGAKVVKRLDELSKAGDVPKCFRDVKTRLPLIVSIVTNIKTTHGALPKDVQQSVDLVVNDCLENIQRLETILAKVTLVQDDSRWKKGLRAFASFTEEARVERISSTLRDSIQILTSVNVTTTQPDSHKPDMHARRPSEAPPLYSEYSSHFLLPFTRDDHFVGREGTLADISKRLLHQPRVAVVGMSGIGKSQVAIEYAYRFHQTTPQAHVFWVYGGSPARFYQAYKRIAQKLKLPSWDDPDVSILELVCNWLNETDDPFLLLLDNADDLAYYWPAKHKSLSGDNSAHTDLSQYIPQHFENGKVLITSRDTRVAKHLTRQAEPLPLHSLTKTEAIRLFSSLDHIDSDEDPQQNGTIGQIVEALGYLPLAITQAACFIAENSISPEEYLEVFLEDTNTAEEFLKEELADARRDGGSTNSAFRAWKMSFDQIAKQKPQAADLLCLLAMLDRQSIPRWLIKAPGTIISLGVLQAFHMITARAGSETFQLHRLTQRFVHMALKAQNKLEHWQGEALACVSNAYPTEIGVQEWPTCDILSPHVHVVTSYEHKSESSRLDLANLLCWAADYDIERGMYEQALRRAKASLDIYQALVPDTDERLASATWLYGRLLFYEATSDDEIRQAETCLRRSLKIAGKNTVTHAESAFELGYIYYSQDRETECIAVSRENFECWQRIGGSAGVRTLDERHDLALQLAMFGREAEAVHHWEEILSLTPKSDAEDQTKLVFTYRSTACIAEFQHDFQLAENLYSKLITLCSDIYHSEHAHVFDYQLSHAEQVLRQGRPSEALQLSRAILESCQVKSEWRITTSCLETIAQCHRLNGEHKEELEVLYQCLDLYQQKLGSSKIYSDIYDVMESIVRCLLTLHEPQKAHPLCETIFSWRDHKLGRKHPDTVTAAQLLAICKSGLKQDAQAKQLLLETANALEPEQDMRLSWNLVVSLWNTEEWLELEKWCRRGLELEESGVFQRPLAAILHKRGTPEEALALQATGLKLEDPYKQSLPVRLELEEPEDRIAVKKRFGRIIHPKSWSS